MPERELSRATPKFLLPSSVELPETSIQAVRQETLHLYENAFRILAHGLGLHRHKILSEEPFETILRAGEEPPEIDIDLEYELTVKTLYGEIVAFISRAQTIMTPEQTEELFALRAAGRDMVEAIKDTKHLRKNLTHYTASKNQAIRSEYNGIRIRLGTVLRRLEVARSQDYLFSVLDLDTMRMEMEESDATQNGTLERLIREDAITTEMATSLMNDAAYAYDVAKNLVSTAGVLFSSRDLEQNQLERSLILDQREINELMGDEEIEGEEEILVDEEDEGDAPESPESSQDLPVEGRSDE
jgi:phosphate:Na+ symporter